MEKKSDVVAASLPRHSCRSSELTSPRRPKAVPTSKIELGKVGRRGYNGAAQAMIRTDKPNCRNKAWAAGNRVCALICSLFAGLAITTGFGPALALDAQADLLATQPRCIAESAFFKNLAKGFRWPDPGDALSLRLLKEYGALFVARGGVALPSVVIFPNQNAVARWQSTLSTEQADLAGVHVKLQSAAMSALMKARQEAVQAHATISPRGLDAAQRSYEETLELWRSRVNPGLQHWVDKSLLSPTEAERIRGMPAPQQVAEILELEKRALYFSKDYSKSVLLSVAPPGASQHLSLLAFDVKEHADPTVRLILERHGWFQTVRSDLPHFTYLGANKERLPSLGLKMVRNGDRVFWIPDFDCPPPAKPHRR